MMPCLASLRWISSSSCINNNNNVLVFLRLASNNKLSFQNVGRRLQQEQYMSSSSSSSSSSSTTNDEDTLTWPISSLTLGLIPTFVQPHLSSISQLPEVQVALQEKKNYFAGHDRSPSKSESNLIRAMDIFSSFQKGGNEHKAILALLAEHFQIMGNFDKALESLQTLAQLIPNDQSNNTTTTPTHLRLKTDVALAWAKALWFNGNFAEAKVTCDEILNDLGDKVHVLPWHFASARTGHALSRLLLAETLDDAFSLRDPPRMVLRFLDDSTIQQHPLAIALARINLGCAEVIWADLLNQIHQRDDAPLDGAMRTWMDGVNLLKRQEGKWKDVTLANAIQARLFSNLAWGVLKMDRGDTNKASELAGKAIKEYDKMKRSCDKEGFGRTLALAATCFQQSGQAVTAEGLLQTALDQPTIVIGPQQIMEQREILLTYSRLLKDWEKREGRGDQLEKKAQLIMDHLNPGWQGKKSPIFSSLWFWTPNLLIHR